MKNRGRKWCIVSEKITKKVLSLPLSSEERLSINTRRCLTARFPFGVIYCIEKGMIKILAVMQLNQKPNYWKDRE